jgi:hypothetical protein
MKMGWKEKEYLIEVEEKNGLKWKLWGGWIEEKVFIFMGFVNCSVCGISLQMNIAEDNGRKWLVFLLFVFVSSQKKR